MASCVCVLGLPDTDSDNVETPGDAKRQGRLFLRMRKEALRSPLSSLILLSFSHFSLRLLSIYLWFWGWGFCFGLGDLGFVSPLPSFFDTRGRVSGRCGKLRAPGPG